VSIYPGAIFCASGIVVNRGGAFYSFISLTEAMFGVEFIDWRKMTNWTTGPILTIKDR